MISFFRNSFFIQHLALLFMAVLLWLPSFVVVPSVMVQPTGVTPLYDFVVSNLGSRPLLLQIMAFVAFVAEAFFFNVILVVGKIEQKVSSIGTFVFIFLVGLTPSQTMFNPALLALLFVLPIMYLLFRLPSSHSVETDLLNVGLCLALASFLYVYSALLLIWVMIALGMMKSQSARLQLIPMIGFLLPYLFYFSIQFILGDIVEVANRCSDFFSNIRISFDGYDIVSVAVFAVLVFFSFLPLNENVLYAQERHVDVRQNISVVSLMFFFTLVMILLDGEVFGCALAFMALSVHDSYSLSNVTKTKWLELVLDLAIIAVYVIHYIPLFS